MKKIVWGILIMGVLWWFWPTQATVKNAGKPVQTIVAFGDSLTAGYGAGGVQNSYPAVLERLSGKRVVNLGLNGDTADNAPTRLPDVLAENPDMVLIEFGANDRIRGGSVERAAQAVAQMVDEVQAAGAIAVVVDTGGPQMGEYTRLYKKLAKEKQAVFVPGIIRGIFNKRNLKSDMIHPNAAGYQIVAERVYKEIKPYL
ncbi:GDSL-type esterase/lipase family protein [Candidatus Avelusimicrobium luingense]|uniref:GDSL-type esterase/lipase family protein n=1 Tax=Candidatus Avelusimicrobium luingense TaxID=3416211 RepID=UPI003D1489C1